MTTAFQELHWARDIEVEEYLRPRSVEEALGMLADHGGRAMVVAGGTDVVPALRQRHLEVRALVDISGISGLDHIGEAGGAIVLGGGTTHAQVAASALVRTEAPILALGAGWVGSPQIRTVATVAGNLVSGQPAADTAIPLLALEARVAIASRDGERVVPLSGFYQDRGRTAVDPRREIITRIEVPVLKPHQGQAHQRLGKRKALTLPMLVGAVSVTVDPASGTIARAAIALGPVKPVPWRCATAEAALTGAPVRASSVEAAAEAAMKESSPRDSCLRGSCDYRLEMVKVFVRRGLGAALAQAGHPLD